MLKLIFCGILLLCCFVDFSCANKEKYTKKNPSIEDSLVSKDTLDFDKIELLFQSATVSPQYYRNYSIEVLPKKCVIKISDYAKELAKHPFKVSKKDWKTLHGLTKKLEKQGVKMVEKATGTSSNTIILYKNDKKIYTFSWDSLSEINQDTEKFKHIIVELIKPNVKELIDKTIQ